MILYVHGASILQQTLKKQPCDAVEKQKTVKTQSTEKIR